MTHVWAMLRVLLRSVRPNASTSSNQVGEIQRLKAALAQQRRLRLGPDVEILLVEVSAPRASLRGRRRAPAGAFRRPAP